MFPYRVKYTESEYDIQNNDLLYKIDQQCQNTFVMLEMFGNVRKHVSSFQFVIYMNSIIQTLYFCSFCNLGFVCFHV